MDNLPKLPKYNPLEIDEGGWIPIREQYMAQEIKKPCTLCLLFPIISFVLIDFLVSLFDLAHTSSWLLIQLLLGSFYVRSYAFQEGKDNKKEMKLSNIMLCLMTGIVLRDIGLFYWLT